MSAFTTTTMAASRYCTGTLSQAGYISGSR